MKRTLLTDLLDWKNEFPYDVALASKTSQDHWEAVTTEQYCENIAKVTRSFLALDWKKNDKILILSRNRPEWLFVELGVGLASGLCGGLYNNSTKEDYSHIFNLVKPRMLFVENKESLSRISPSSLVGIEYIVVFEGEANFDERAITYKKFLEFGISRIEKFEYLIRAFDSSQPSFIIFTSGTTGAPKAALISHDNLYFAASCYRNRWNPPQDGKLYSFLPASHIAEKVYSLGHGLHFKYPVYFASDLMNVLAEMVDVQPVAFLATPRIWQKMMEKTDMSLKRVAPGIPTHLLNLARQLSMENQKLIMQNKTLPFYKKAIFNYLDKKVLMPIRFKLGLSKAIKAVSGAAALPIKVRLFFRSLGVNIIESYAQTESSGILSGQLGVEDCAGTIGFPVPELEVKITDDGEIITKGKHVFCGYLNDDEATLKVVKNDWLFTGDLGEWNEKGQIVFMGRKRDIIKPLEGKMIAPSKIEDKILTCPLVSQAVVFGDAEKYLVALVTPDLSSGVTYEFASSIIDDHIKALNRDLARHERVFKYLVLNKDFSLEKGELTPTLKTKRHIILKNFHNEIEALFERYPQEKTFEPELTIT